MLRHSGISTPMPPPGSEAPPVISQVTEEVLDEVKASQNRPLEAVCPIVYLDALWVKIRDQAIYARDHGGSNREVPVT